ncbi:MAG: exopolysaccharide biosynthesis polyprenyl glycosylphosphotransferase [Acidobacteriota bacterium]
MSRQRSDDGRDALLRGLRTAGDLVIAAGTLFMAFTLRTRWRPPFSEALLPADRWPQLLAVLPLVLVAQSLLLYFFGLYDREPLARSEILGRLTGAMTGLGATLIAWHYLADRALPRSVFLGFIAFDGSALFLWRWLLQRARRVAPRRVAIVGCGTAAREVAAGIAARQWHGLRIVGWVPAPGEAVETADDVQGPCLGTVQDLPALLDRGEIDDIILAPSVVSWQTELVDRLATSRPEHTSLLLVPGPYESLIGQLRYRWVRDIPLVEVVRENDWGRRRPVKRALDLGGAAALLLAASPAMAVVALWIRICAGRGVIYRQIRVGRQQQPFTLLKFRTMHDDAEPLGEVLASAGDPRFIPGGAALRRLRLDELPQLINVLNGSMSLVGPRPERPGFVRTFLAAVPGYAERFVVPPGVTGLAQVNGDYHSSAANKLRYDLAYVANWSLWLDLSILFRTVRIVLTSRGV